jgi:polyferredoxin
MSPDNHISGKNGTLDFLQLPVIGYFLRWRYSRMFMQSILFVIAILMIVHGLFGPQLAPRNLSTLLTWVHYRGALVLVLLVAGNFFCMACPFMLPRELVRRFSRPVRNWPRVLRNKWLSLGLFVLILFAYELFDLWGSPWWTAWLIIAYFSAALLVDAFFKNASFCKYVCPIGQFNFISSTVSPLEIKVADADICANCTTKDCIKGTRDPDSLDQIIQRGCELALFQPKKTGNMDCTFCLDCVHACPHDNVALTARLPGSELWDDTRRSGIGRFSKRSDISVLALIFTFGALLNAFGMVSPVYAFQTWLAGVLGTTSETTVLGTLFFIMLVVEPVVLLGLAAWITRNWTGSDEKLLPVVMRYAFALIPLGFGLWVAHYSFHLFTGIWTFIPVIQDTLANWGLPLFGDPLWRLSGLSPEMVYPLELGFLGLGLWGSLLVTYRISVRYYKDRPWRAFIPWAVLCIVLCSSAIWLLNQPMEMRGMFLGG